MVVTLHLEGLLKVTNSLVEPSMKVSDQNRLYIATKLVQDQQEVPIKFINVNN